MAMFVVLYAIEKHKVPRSPTGTELTKTLLLTPLCISPSSSKYRSGIPHINLVTPKMLCPRRPVSYP